MKIKNIEPKISINRLGLVTLGKFVKINNVYYIIMVEQKHLHNAFPHVHTDDIFLFNLHSHSIHNKKPSIEVEEVNQTGELEFNR